ncbi:MAG: tetratricopeptide repeat protein [Gemmatimonadetes bacterium]|nr:MAG: tetratricopeptide repeat protein [Gemmatimonadota bacterium]
MKIEFYPMVCCFFVWISCSPSTPPARQHQTADSTSSNHAIASAFVGDKACAKCHAKIYKSYKQTGMGRSFYPSTRANRIEDYQIQNTVYHEASNLYYEMVQEGDQFYQREYRLDENGQRIHELTRRVDYIIGSGNHTRSYITLENGFMHEMPVTWYVDKGLWDMSPGYEQSNSRFSRPILQECLDCHNAYTDYVPYSDYQYREPIPHGINCERCHGAGRAHVTLHSDENVPDEVYEADVDTTIINPAHLPPGKKLDVCLQCHLQGEMTVFKGDRFEPGMSLSDTRSIFVPDGLPEGDFRIASHGARTVLSACYQKSNGDLTCITCHNPHEPVASVPRERFNQICQECHSLAELSQTPSTGHQVGEDCVSCHMRQGDTSDIPHVNFTDHWIRRKIDPLTETEIKALFAADQPVTLTNFYGSHDRLDSLELGIAYVKYYDAKSENFLYLERATPLLEAGLAAYPDHQKGHYFLGRAYMLQEKFEEAEAQFATLTEINPTHAQAFFQLGKCQQVLERLEDAIRSYQKSLELFPDNAISYNNLGNIYSDLERFDEAQAAYQKAVNIQPSYATTYYNWAHLHLYQLRQFDEGYRLLLKAIQYEPNFLMAKLDLGNYYLSQNQLDKAEAQFREIIQINPRFTGAYGNLALIYHAQGKIDEAISMVERLLSYNPMDQKALMMMMQLKALQ